MMDYQVIYLVLYALAAFCFLGFAIGKSLRSVHLLGLGVFFWSLVPLIETLRKVFLSN